MLSKETYNTIRERLKSGVYRSICLVRKVSADDDEIICSHNRIKGTENADKPLAKLDYFKMKLNRELPSGDYEIQAKASVSHNAVDKFPVHVAEKKQPVQPENNNGVSEHLSDYELNEDSEEFMDIEEYKKMAQENIKLLGQVTILTIERDWYKKQLEMKELATDKGLSDKSSASNIFSDLAKETIPGVVNLLDNYISMRKDEFKNRAESRNGKVKVKKQVPTGGTVNLNQLCVYYFNLLNTDEERANNELDALEQQNPDVYAQVFERLWPEGEEEQEEEEEGEGEEEETEEEQE
jgi:hypothetical protein